MNGNLVKQRIFELGISKEQLAVKMECSIATVYNMLAGRRISERNLFRAAKVLGVDTARLDEPDMSKRRRA